MTKTYDCLLDGRELFLVRDEKGRRAWQRSDLPDSRATRTEIDSQYGQLDSKLRVPKVFRSGHAGYGHSEARLPDTYHYAVNGDASLPETFLRSPQVNEITLPAGTGAISGFFELGGDLYAVGTRTIVRIDGDDVAISDYAASADLQPNPVVWKGYAYVGLGSSGFVRANAAGGWAVTADVAAVGFTVGENIVDQVLVRATPTAGISLLNTAADDPTQAVNWSAAITVGETSAAITGLIGLAGRLYVGKEDGFYNVDEAQRARPLLPQLQSPTNSRNCQHLRAYGPGVLVPHLRGLWLADEAAQEFLPIQPGYQTSNLSPARGQITATVVDGAWVYAAAVNGAGDTTIFKGRFPAPGETMPGYFVWHPWLTFPGVVCDALHVSGRKTNPCLYFGLNTGSIGQAKWVTLPRGADANPLDDGNCRTGTEATFYFPATDYGSPGTKKVLSALEIATERTTANDWWEFSVRADGGAWIGLGEVRESGPVTLRPAVTIAGDRLDVRATSKASSVVAAATASLLKKIVISAVERPPVVGLVNLQIRLERNQERPDRVPLSRAARSLLTALRELGERRTPTTLIDPWDQELYGYVLPQKEWGEKSSDSQNAELETVLGLQFVILEEIGGVFRWDISDWDGGDVWGRDAAAEAFVWNQSLWDGDGAWGVE